MAEAKIVEVVQVWSTIGRGTEDDPCREIVEWFQKDGTLIHRYDSWAEEVKRQIAEKIEVVPV